MSWIEDRVKELLVEELNLDVRPDELSTDGSLIEGLGMDSAGILAMVSSLEDEFEIELDDDEINRDTFATVAAIVTVVQRKRT